MGIEIERKFLVANEAWRIEATASIEIRQAYLANTSLSSIRVRTAGDKANINIKQMQIGPSHGEFEYEIPLKDAEEMLAGLCETGEIVKTRYYVDVATHTWEIDVFAGANAGLVIAEIELASVDEEFLKPGWLGREVTHEERYYNVALAHCPWSEWSD